MSKKANLFSQIVINHGVVIEKSILTMFLVANTYDFGTNTHINIKIVVFIIGLLLTYSLHKSKNEEKAVLYGMGTLLFNPIASFRFEQDTWAVLSVIGSILILIDLFSKRIISYYFDSKVEKVSIKKVVNTFVILVLTAVLFLFTWTYTQTQKTIKKTETRFAPKQTMEVTTTTHKEEDIYIEATRKIFNNYLAGDIEDITEEAVEGLGTPDTGLKSFPKEYFSERFTVLNIRNGIAGGKEMNIVFENHPEEVFWVWTYRLANGTYQIKGFQLNTLTNKNK